PLPSPLPRAPLSSLINPTLPPFTSLRSARMALSTQIRSPAPSPTSSPLRVAHCLLPASSSLLRAPRRAVAPLPRSACESSCRWRAATAHPTFLDACGRVPSRVEEVMTVGVVQAEIEARGASDRRRVVSVGAVAMAVCRPRVHARAAMWLLACFTSDS
ncbi:unnamed protein product, partial [Urochloa humidicola]